MNKFYVILPVALLILFGGYYFKVAKPEMAAKVLADEKRIAEERQAEDAKRKDIEAKAQDDARKAQAVRDAKEHERLEKAQRDKDEQDRKVLDETTKYEKEAEKLSKQIAALEIEITNLRNKREDMNREVLELAKKGELAKIDRRNAELEIQRMYDIVAQKVAASSLTQAPPPPPAK
jgi:predicted RNase H-like nuclease (RuvC/YqgF family)